MKVGTFQWRSALSGPLLDRCFKSGEGAWRLAPFHHRYSTTFSTFIRFLLHSQVSTTRQTGAKNTVGDTTRVYSHQLSVLLTAMLTKTFIRLKKKKRTKITQSTFSALPVLMSSKIYLMIRLEYTARWVLFHASYSKIAAPTPTHLTRWINQWFNVGDSFYRHLALPGRTSEAIMKTGKGYRLVRP